MKRHLVLTAIALTIVLCLSNCTHRMTDFTVISTKNVPIGGGHPVEFKKGTTRVVGKDTKHMVLFIPLGSPNLKDAIDRAIQSTPGCIGLVDGVVKSNFWWAILYGQNKYIVEGTPLFDDSNEYQKPMNSTSVGYQQIQNNYQPNTMPVRNDYQQSIDNNASNTNGLVFTHTVKDGEALIDIAKAYGVKVADLIKWNNLSSSNLYKGQTLRIIYSE